MFDRRLSCLVYWRLQRMRDDVHIRSDGRLIYNRQDGCVDTSICLLFMCILVSRFHYYKSVYHFTLYFHAFSNNGSWPDHIAIIQANQIQPKQNHTLGLAKCHDSFMFFFSYHGKSRTDGYSCLG